MIDFSLVSSLVESAIITLEAKKTSPGPLLKDSLQDAVTSPTFCGHNITMEGQKEFQKMTSEFLDAVVSNLRARFPSTDIVLAMSILDPRTLPTESRSHNYGDESLFILLQHFGTDKLIEEQVFLHH